MCFYNLHSTRLQHYYFSSNIKYILKDSSQSLWQHIFICYCCTNSILDEVNVDDIYRQHTTNPRDGTHPVLLSETTSILCIYKLLLSWAFTVEPEGNPILIIMIINPNKIIKPFFIIIINYDNLVIIFV